MAPAEPKSTLRSKLTLWLMLVAAIPLCTATIIVYFQRVEVIKKNQLTKLSAIRDLKVEEINSWLDVIAADIRTFARDRSLRHVLNDTGIDRNVHMIEVSSFFSDIVANYKSYGAVSFVEPTSGKIIISTEKRLIGTSFILHKRAREALIENRFYIETIHGDKTTGESTMWASTPVSPTVDGDRDVSQEGVLVLTIDLEKSLYAILLARTGFGETGESLLIDENVTAISALRWYGNAPLRLKIDAVPALRAARGHTGVIEANDYRQIPVLAAFTHIPRMRWGFVAKQDLEEVYAPIGAMVVQLAVLLSVVLGAVILIAFVIARSISKPVSIMARTSARIAAGELTVRNSVVSNDELGYLASSFNALTDALVERLDVQSALGQLVVAMVGPETKTEFSEALICSLIEKTNADMGAMYAHTNGNDMMEAIASLGLSREALHPFDVSKHEGIIGSAAEIQQLTHLSLGPNAPRFTHRTVAGELDPSELVTVPIRAKGKLVAAVLLGSINGFSKVDLEVLKELQPSIATSFMNVAAADETRRLASVLETKNTELTAQTEEMKRQSSELQQQTVELREQRREVEKANRLKSQFLSNMSHELRTPLNAILSIPQALLAKPVNGFGEKEQNYLRVIERNGKALLALINDILDLSKIEAGKSELKMTRFPIAGFLEEIADSLRPLAQKKGLYLKMELSPQLKEVRTDRQKLRQVVVNIISNAIKFTSHGGVTLVASTDRSQFFLRVIDTGIGIDQEDIEIIFDEFRQIDGSTARAYEGTGLGLSISKRLVALLEGGIQANSRKGEGSTFTISIPIEPQARTDELSIMPSIEIDATQEADSVLPGPSQVIESDIILVVEDNEDALEQIVALVKEMGMSVVPATGGEKALEETETYVPRGIILDLMMPGIDGFEFLEHLRSVPDTANTPVLVVTAKELTLSEKKKLEHSHVKQLVIKGSLDRKQLQEKILSTFGLSASIEPHENISKESGQAEVSAKRDRSVIRKAVPETKPVSILMIEDIPDNRLAMELLLDDLESTVTSVENGKEGIEKTKALSPDIILLDVQMPGMSGFETLERLRNAPESSGIPVVAVTARAMKSEQKKIRDAGFDAFLSKPVDKGILMDTLAYLLERSDTVPPSVEQL